VTSGRSLFEGGPRRCMRVPLFAYLKKGNGYLHVLLCLGNLSRWGDICSLYFKNNISCVGIVIPPHRIHAKHRQSFSWTGFHAVSILQFHLQVSVVVNLTHWGDICSLKTNKYSHVHLQCDC